MAGANGDFIRSFAGAACLVTAGIVFLVFNGAGFSNGYLIDSQNYIAGRDFVNFWHYAIAAWQDNTQQYYDPYWYNQLLDQLTQGTDYPDQLWSYPPHFMILMAPFGLIGYNLAFALFTMIGLFVWWRVAVRPFENSSASLALFTPPFVAICLISGQLSLFVAAIFVWLYRNIDARPVVSGIIIAVLTVKPHLGLLVPLYLVLTQRWLVFASASVSTLLFVGCSVLVHGIGVWQVYFDLGLKYQSQILEGTTTLVDGLMPTVLMNMIVAGAPASLAIGAHIAIALMAIIWFVIMVRNSSDHFIQFAALIIATFIISPYMMAYDFLILVWLMVMLAYRHRFDHLSKTVFRLIVLLPVLSVVMANFAIAGSAITTILLAFWLWQLRGSPQTKFKHRPTELQTQ